MADWTAYWEDDCGHLKHTTVPADNADEAAVAAATLCSADDGNRIYVVKGIATCYRVITTKRDGLRLLSRWLLST